MWNWRYILTLFVENIFQVDHLLLVTTILSTYNTTLPCYLIVKLKSQPTPLFYMPILLKAFKLHGTLLISTELKGSI